MKTILVIGILICPLVLMAQDVKTTNLSWSVSGLSDLRTSKSESYTCVFETQGTRDIVWKQRRGSYSTTLNVSSVEGTWLDIKSIGQVVYQVSVDGQSGTLTFERSDAGLFVTLDLSQPIGERLKLRLPVNQVVALN
jgi:hypothetical protein